MFPSPLIVGAGDCALEANSTAPTTPDGSLTFSPVIHASQILDAFDASDASDSGIATRLGGSLTSLHLNGTAPMRVRNICCIGAGYVGGPTSAIIALQNPEIRVNVVDRDARRIASWNSRHLPIHENGLSDIVRIARDGSNACSFHNVPSSSDDLSSESGNEDHRDEISLAPRQPNLFFSTDVARCISEADIILVTVNTPTKKRGKGAGKATDVTALEGVTREIALNARPGTILVEKSTVPCGTAQLIKDTLEIHRPGVHFEILSNPEFLAEGTAVKDLLTPDRVIIGSSDTPSGHRAASILASVYSAWVPRARITTINIWSSELSKLVANAMLAQRISSINSISAICEKTGADIKEIALAVGLDPRIGPQYLQSSLGFGGSCFKKDILNLVYLAESLGLPEVAEYWQQVLTLNEFQHTRFAERVITRLNNTLGRKKITLLGYAFKKNTSDTRESPALPVIATLLHDAPGEIAIFDPCCDADAIRGELSTLDDAASQVKIYDDVYAACAGSHAILILTEWDCFRFSAPASTTPSKVRKAIQKKHSATRIDPRPLQCGNNIPSESDLLALHNYLSSPSSSLQRYIPEPQCELSCSLCKVGKEEKVQEQLDWRRVVKGLESPKWVFDGRGIVDGKAMEALGFRVEAVGKR